jgi:oxygen-independent coproporphyrinogen-3 oxidase
VAKTAQQAAELKPDRISVFGYAHVPWFKKHQKMISDADLPGINARYDQATTIERELNALGYASIGLDHFALEHDELTAAARKGLMRRNFQGYTTDVSDALLAFGASAIGEFPQGFVQSARDTLEWSQKIDRNESPVTRGLATTAEDRMRSEVIERLMCDLTVDAAEIATRHGFDPAIFADVPERLEPAVLAGIAMVKGSRVSVLAKHRLFLRTVAAAYDAHFVAAPNRHAKAV